MATASTATGKKTISKITTHKTIPSKATHAPVKKIPAKKAISKTPVGKKPAVKVKTAAKKSALPKAAKVTGAEKNTSKVQQRNATVAPEERYKLIAAAAYSRAERRGFASGHALDDWIAAEKEVDAMLKA